MFIHKESRGGFCCIPFLPNVRENVLLIKKETYPHWKTLDCLIFQTLILISITRSLFIVPKTESQCSGKPVGWSGQHTLSSMGKGVCYSKEQAI